MRPYMNDGPSRTDQLDLGESAARHHHDGERAGFGTHGAAGDRGVHMGDAAQGQAARVILTSAGLIELMSTTIVPGRSASATPEPNSACSTI